MDAPRRILIIRPSALGDVCRTVPALATLRRAWPEAEIDWLVRRGFGDAVRGHPMLDGVVALDRSGAGGLFAAGRTIRSRRYDVVYDLQGLARSGLLTAMSGAGRRVGDRRAREFAWLGYNRRVDVPRGLHTVDAMLGVLEGDGLAAVRDMTLHVTADDRAWAESYLAEHGVEVGAGAVLAPTARWLCKCWPVERYAKVGERLMSLAGRYGVGDRVIVLASPSESDAMGPLMKALGERALAPETTVGRAMALVGASRLVVCNDSAPLHMAVGLGRPIVTIFGPTDPSLVGPYRRLDAVVQPAGVGAMGPRAYRRHRDDQTLISRVTVEQVWARVEAALAGPRVYATDESAGIGSDAGTGDGASASLVKSASAASADVRG